MKKARQILIKISIFTVLLGFSIAGYSQSTDKFFGMNYWEYAEYTPGVITDKFEDNIPTLESWNTSFVRIGGNYNNTKPQGQNKEWYDRPIQNALSIGAIPLVQLPIDLTPTEVGDWMDYFNDTRGYNIQYWAIGNEPDPSNGLNEWFTGAPGGQHDGRNYTGFRGQFRILARKIKEKDPNSIVCGPDFRMWYGNANESSTAAGSPFGTYYKDFLYGGTNPVGTDAYNGDQLIDIFVLHFYGDGGKADFDEGDYIEKYGQMMQLIDATNAQRPADQQLKIAVGEFNDANAKGFKAGQRMATMAKQSLKNGAVFMTPWSISEGTDYYPMISKETGAFYSTAYHWELLSQNRRAVFMDSEQNLNNDFNIVSFGMKDANGYTIMLINEGDNEYIFSVNFSETTGAYNSANTPLKFRFDVDEPASAFSGVTLYPNSTILYTYNNLGQRLRKYEYREGYSEPTMYPFPDVEPTVNFTTAFAFGLQNSYEEGDDIPVVVELDPTPSLNSNEYSVQLLLSQNGGAEVSIRYENLAPFEWANDLVDMQPGDYELKAIATRISTGEQSEAVHNFVVNAAGPDCSTTMTEYRLDGVWLSGATDLEVDEGTEVVLSILPNDGTGLQITFPDGTIANNDYNLGNVTTANSGTYVMTSGAGCQVNLNLTVKSNQPANLTTTDFQLINQLSGNYLKSLNGSATGVIIQENQTNPPPAAWFSFQWYFVESGFLGNYHIFNKNTGKNFRPTGGSMLPGVNMEQMAVSHDLWVSESWIIEPSNVEGYFWIKNRKSGLYLRPADGSQNSLAEIVQDELVPSYGSFRWQFVAIYSLAARESAIVTSNKTEFASYRIYPNPAKDMLYISEAVQWKLFDVFGKEISSGEGKEISVSGLHAGVYLVKANDSMHRIIVE